jgi:hypothetical protein
MGAVRPVTFYLNFYIKGNTMKTYTDSETFKSDFQWLSVNDYLHKSFLNNLSVLIDAKSITVTVNNINPVEEEWDGLMFVNISSTIKLFEVVNNIISPSFADEIFMENEYELRLWWD